ncbi:MAG: hypothetical protein ACHP65_09175 [Legionellales bacterium]
MTKQIVFIMCLFLAQTSSAQAKQYTQCNLVIALDPMNTERFVDGEAAVAMTLRHHMHANDTCIITTNWALQRIDLHSPKIAAAFTRYQEGVLVLLIPKKLAHIYGPENGINPSQFWPFYTNFPNPDTERSLYPVEVMVSSLLCLRLLRKTFKKCAHVTWNVLVMGHGLPYGQTAGFTEGYFKGLVSFFKNELHTRTFFYDSCYAGGKMLEYMGIDKEQFPFLLVCPCTGENSSFSFEDSYVSMSKISQLNNINDINEITALLASCIHPMNAPQIRLPHGTQFYTPNLQGVKMQAIKGTNSTCEVVKGGIFYVDQNTTIFQLKNLQFTDLLLKAAIIKNSLLLEKGNHITSTLKGDSWHYLEKIEAPMLSKEEVFDAFCEFALHHTHAQKIFLLNKVLCKGMVLKNVVIALNSITPSSPTTLQYEIFYMIGDSGFRIAQPYPIGAKNDRKECRASPKLILKYNALFKMIKERIELGKQPIRVFYNKYVRLGIFWERGLEMALLMAIAIPAKAKAFKCACMAMGTGALLWWYKNEIITHLRFLDLQDDDVMSRYARRLLAL